MIVMSQVVNWAPIMYKTTNSNGPDKVAGYKVSTGLSAFFIVFVIFGAFFITNLFVGVVISAYNRESQRLGKDFLLTDKQKKYKETKVLVLKMRPKISMVRPTHNKFRTQCYDLAEHKSFEFFILVSILLNTIVLAIKWPNMSAQTSSIIEIINYIFTGIFLIEAIIKISAFGKRYFKEKWNTFDFLIVVFSIVFVLVGFITGTK